MKVIARETPSVGASTKECRMHAVYLVQFQKQ